MESRRVVHSLKLELKHLAFQVDKIERNLLRLRINFDTISVSLARLAVVTVKSE